MDHVTICCLDCDYLTDVELSDETAPRHCPYCYGDLEVVDTGMGWPLTGEEEV